MSTEKRKSGRPPHSDPPKPLPLKAPSSLVEAVEQHAAERGLSRNKAGIELLRLGLKSGQCPILMPPSTGGYNPLTGEFDDT